MSARTVPTIDWDQWSQPKTAAELTPSLSGLNLKSAAPQRRAVPTAMNNDEASGSSDKGDEAPKYSDYDLFGSDSDGDDPKPEPAPAPAPAAAPVISLDSDDDEPMPQAPAPAPASAAAAPTADETRAKAMELKRKMDQLKAEADEAKRQKKALAAELKEKKQRAAEEAAQAKIAKAQQAEADRLEKEAEKKRKAEQAEADRAAKAAEKAEQQAAKEAAKQAAAEAAAAAKAAKAAAKAEKEEAAAAAKAEKEAEKAEKEAQRLAEKEAKEAAKAEKEAQKAAVAEAAADAKAAAAEAKLQQQKAKKEAAEAAAAEKAAAKAKKEAEAKAAEAEAERQRLEEECADLLEAIHRTRWEMRGLGVDFKNQLQAYKDLNCEEVLNGATELPKWMEAMIPIFERMSKEMEDAENEDPVAWELEDEDGHEGEHTRYAKQFDKENAEAENEEQDPDDMDVVGKFKQGAANAEEEDEEVDWEPDTLQVDIKLLVRNVKDDTEEKELWRAKLITHDYENRIKGDYVSKGPDPDNPQKTLYEFVLREEKPYPSEIPAEYVEAYKLEKMSIERAVQVLIQKMCPDCDPSVAESVAGGPLSPYDAPWVAQQNMELQVGQKQTYWNIGFQFPDRSEENQERARSVVEQMLNASTQAWSSITMLSVVQVSGVADKAGFLAAQSQMDAMVEKGFKLTKEENEYVEATEGKDWKVKLTPQNQLKVVMQVREMFEEMDRADRAKKGAAAQRQIGDDDAAMVQKADKGK